MSETVETVRSLFIPIRGGNLLLPGTVVAEIVPLSDATPPDGEAPAWLMGTVDWRDQRIPLVSFEAIIGGDVPRPTRTSRIAVLKALSNNAELPYFGVVTQQIPRLLTIFDGGLEPVDDGEQGAAVAARVLASGEPVTIPQMDYIEQELRRLIA